VGLINSLAVPLLSFFSPTLSTEHSVRRDPVQPQHNQQLRDVAVAADECLLACCAFRPFANGSNLSISKEKVNVDSSLDDGMPLEPSLVPPQLSGGPLHRELSRQPVALPRRR
jgi:hypothetical protein